MSVLASVRSHDGSRSAALLRRGQLLSPTVRDEWCAHSRAKGAAWREAAQAGEAPRASAAKRKGSSRDYRIHGVEFTALDVRARVLCVCVSRHVIGSKLIVIYF